MSHVFTGMSHKKPEVFCHEIDCLGNDIYVSDCLENPCCENV